jgi:hypothetical protein
VAVKTLEDIRLALFEVTADKAKTQLIVVLRRRRHVPAR